MYACVFVCACLCVFCGGSVDNHFIYTLNLKVGSSSPTLYVGICLCFHLSLINPGIPVVSSLKTRLLALQVLGAIMGELSDTTPDAQANCANV